VRVRCLSLAVMLLLAGVAPANAQPAGVSDDGERLLGPNGAPLFVTGFNYEGPADRAWQMWDDSHFGAGLIDADFGRAQATGANALRVFVQAPLAVDIAAGKWSKLDLVVGLAEQHGLGLILSLHDYGEVDLGRVSATAGQIAGRYRGRVGLLALDLKNEPRFGDLALAHYAAPVPLQQRGLIDTFGERLPRDELADYRASDEGRQTIPAALADDAAWIYINNLRLYRELLAEAADWVKAGGYKGTTLEYLDDPAGAKWAPFVAALNATLEAWLGPQVAAIRAADPGRIVTVDHVDAVLARLPANDALDVETLHRYPATGGAAVRATLSLLNTLQHAHPGRPYLLGEFGYATQSLDPDRAALHETAVWLGLLAQHAAGGSKWMLNDMPDGFNMRERTLGAWRLDGTAKPIVAALAALHSYLSVSGSPAGSLRLDDDPDTGLRYVYRASDGLFLGGKHVDGGAASLEAGGPAQLFVSWTEPGSLRLWASAPLHASLDLGQLLGSVPNAVSLAALNADGSEQPAKPVARQGGLVSLDLGAGTVVLHAGAPPGRGADYDIAGGHFFTQTNGHAGAPTGYSVTDAQGIPLWSAFQRLGGTDVLGYPVSRRFELDGFVVQAFQKAVLQWHPEQGQFAFLNTFDVLHDRGRDGWLASQRQTPPPADASADRGLGWDAVVARHLGLLDGLPAPLKAAFFADPDWLDHFGLPVATHEYPNVIVVRAQRAAFQYWKEAVPWAAKGSVTVANGGDLAKEAGLFPWLAVTPENAPR